MKTEQVRAGRDTILSIAEKAGPVDVIAELVWNALDAEATLVDVDFTITDMGAPDEIFVTDNGHGMSYDFASDAFLVDDESWKKAKRFSPNVSRPLHGKRGRGRFLAYGLADHVEWRSVATVNGANHETVVLGSYSAVTSYDFDGPFEVDAEPGTRVRLELRQDAKTVRLTKDDLALHLTARLAPTLIALPAVEVLFRGSRLKPQEYVIRSNDIPLEVSPGALKGHQGAKLRVIEWSKDLHSKSLFLCDENGSVVSEHKPSRAHPAPVNWSAYLLWPGFGDSEVMDAADLRIPHVRHGEIIEAALRELRAHLNERLQEEKGRVLAVWKSEGVYPYAGDPASPSEEVEREIFDVVAVVASPAIGRDVRQKRFSLQLIREATRSGPSKLNRIINAVLDLTDDEKTALADLLERTRLPKIVQAAQTIADRSDFLKGLSSLLFADETRRLFREVDQLHPMLVTEPWLFGDEWTLSLSESGLTKVVHAAMKATNPDVEFQLSPVVLPTGKRGRVDMAFYKHLPESERSRHLVVELKRPMRLTMVEFSQLNNYATAITDHPAVAGETNQWDFWLVGTDVDKSIERLREAHPSQPGLVAVTNRYRLWVVKWAWLIDQASRRIEALRAAIELVSSDESSREYLQRVHADFIPDSVRRSGEAIAS